MLLPITHTRCSLPNQAVPNRKLICAGMTLDEAIPVVDKAIDDALIAGIGQLRLIHGREPVLRAGLTAYLSTNRFVEKTGNGGAGGRWQRRYGY